MNILIAALTKYALKRAVFDDLELPQNYFPTRTYNITSKRATTVVKTTTTTKKKILEHHAMQLFLNH